MAEPVHDNIPGKGPHEVGVIQFPPDPNREPIASSDSPSPEKPILRAEEKQGFVKKVFGIVTSQLIVTFALCYCGKAELQ